MTVIITAILFSLVLGVLARRANARFWGEDRLPMQWGLTGDVTWSAPRAVALAFVPMLGVFVFASLIMSSSFLPSRHGQEGMALPACIGIGLTLITIQLFYFWLIGKTLRRSGS